MTENDVHMVWLQKQVIMCWFVTFGSFRAKGPKPLTFMFLSHNDGKQQQNNPKLYTKDLGENVGILRLVSIFARFLYLGSCSFVLSIF